MAEVCKISIHALQEGKFLVGAFNEKEKNAIFPNT